MPILEYKCDKCDKTKEIITLSILNKPTEVLCDICNGIMKQILGTFRPIFKGEGWAKDGYSSKKE